MDMRGSETINAPVETVWKGLNDPDILRQCIPGCQSLEKTSDTEMKATVVLKIGPVKAKFEGAVELSNLNPPHSYTISGEGKGGMVGFAKGGADVALEPQPDGTTLLTYSVKADVGGKIAQLGARLIDSTAKSLAEKFFASFSETVAQGGTAA
ncbi:MAG: carbon monoxide dehydrogenase subunit G [Rhizobium sp.]|nr:carbon monoxide dehydrogenase subunit G [Rhizobium sp.]